jgi:hypothetical protein
MVAVATEVRCGRGEPQGAERSKRVSEREARLTDRRCEPTRELRETAPMSDTVEPLCEWSIPNLDLTDTHVVIGRPGTITVIVGANGAGKSALGHWLETHAQGPVRRLIAHRRLWLQHSGPEITSARRENLTANMSQWSLESDSRWLDHANNDRASVVLFDLLARINERNARLAELVDSGVAEQVSERIETSLLTRINAILRNANLDVQLVLTENAAFDTVASAGATRYPISQMSGW